MRFLGLCSLMMLAACQLGSSTEGSSGKVSFDYTACFFGCNLDAAMMTGTKETIRVTGSVIPAVSVRSSDETVMSVGAATRSCCAGSGACRTLASTTPCNDGESVTLDVPVFANNTGSAQLVLDQGGTPFDFVTLKVAAPQKIVLSCGRLASIALPKSEQCALSWTASDADGNALVASSGVTATTSDPNVASLSNGFVTTNESKIAASQGFLGSFVTANAVGQATITATASGQTSTVSVSVTP
jgi:hypothetical protein